MATRFGPRAYREAVDEAIRQADDGLTMIHVVEVFDEELVRNAKEGVDMGPLYVVPETELAAFTDEHDGEVSVQETFGVDSSEVE